MPKPTTIVDSPTFKRDDKAFSDFTEAIRLKPDYAEAYYHRGLTYFYKKDYGKAINDYTEAIRLRPKLR